MLSQRYESIKADRILHVPLGLLVHQQHTHQVVEIWKETST